jgi:hypothetical protein
MRAVGAFAWLLIATLPRLGFAQEVQPQPPAPATSLGELVSPADTDQPAAPTLRYFGRAAAAPTTATRVELGFFDTIAESVFGETDPNAWRPLTLSTFFSEGWLESWVPSPNGSGGAPRQGWINAMDGNFYRLWFFTFAQDFNSGNKGDAYLGAYTLYTPFSRRFLLITNVPFAVRNTSTGGQPIVNPSGGRSQQVTSQSTFGDLSFTPRVLLHETKDFTLTAEVSVLVPTGRQPVAGKSGLTPALGFWYNFAGRWTIRGGFGDLVPVNHHTTDTLISQLAIGQTLTDHDVPLFGDFTWYVSAVVDTPLKQGKRSTMTLTPGMRTHLGNDWYFLAGLPTPVTAQRLGGIGMIFWFMKAW